MPQQPFLSEIQAPSNTKRVIDNTANQQLIEGLGPLLKEANKNYQSSKLSKDIGAVTEQTKAGYKQIQDLENQVGSITAKMVNEGRDLDAAENQQVLKLQEEIARAKRGEDAGVLTPSAGQAYITSKVREFSNRYPAFADTFRSVGEQSISGYNSNSVVAAFANEEDVQKKVDLQQAKEMESAGYDWNNPADRQTYKYMQRRKFDRQYQLQDMVDSRQINSSKFYQIATNGYFDGVMQIMRQSGVLTGANSDIEGVKASIAALKTSQTIAMNQIANQSGMGEDQRREAQSRLDSLDTAFKDIFESGDPVNKLRKMVEAQDLALRYNVNIQFPEMAMMSKIDGGLETWTKVAQEISLMTPNARQTYSKANPALWKMYESMGGLVEEKDLMVNFMGQYVKDLGMDRVDPTDPNAVANARLYVHALKKAGKSTSEVPSPEATKLMDKSIDVLMQGRDNNSYDLKDILGPTGRGYVKRNPQTFKNKMTATSVEIQDRFQKYGLPSDAKVVWDPNNNVVAILDKDGKYYGVSVKTGNITDRGNPKAEAAKKKAAELMSAGLASRQTEYTNPRGGAVEKKEISLAIDQEDMDSLLTYLRAYEQNRDVYGDEEVMKTLAGLHKRSSTQQK